MKQPTRSHALSLLLAACLLICLAPHAQAAQPIQATNDRATLVFPNQITFRVELAGANPIQSATLEYSVDQLTCGTVKARALPAFRPALRVQAAWTWKMEESGSLPPGAQVRWQWRVNDNAGNQLLTEPRAVIWLDDLHPWHTLSSQKINLHWYQGNEAFGRRMLGAAQAALTTVSQKLGLQASRPIELYLYADGDEMRQAVFYKPDWTGGMAYPAHNIAIIGIAPDDETWGQRAIAHEITHIVVDRYGFSCLGSRPTWLDEGLAVFIEGGPTDAEQEQFQTALDDDNLIALSALDAGFGKDDYTVSLAYTESYSLVNFLLMHYGRDRLLSFIDLLRNGAATQPALQAAYGLDEFGLEDAWRSQIGAKRQGAGVTPPATRASIDLFVFAPVVASGGQHVSAC